MDVTTAEARRQLAELLNRVAYGRETVVVTRHGREMAAIVPIDDHKALEALRSLLGDDDVGRALSELETGTSVSWNELKKDLSR